MFNFFVTVPINGFYGRFQLIGRGVTLVNRTDITDPTW